MGMRVHAGVLFTYATRRPNAQGHNAREHHVVMFLSTVEISQTTSLQKVNCAVISAAVGRMVTAMFERAGSR